MASQQRVSEMKGGRPEHQPENDAQRLQWQLQELHLGCETQAGPIPLADLPGPWFTMLIRGLQPSQRLALLRTCKTVAAAVARHSKRLILVPDTALQHDRARRTFVLKLAANCSNVWMCVGTLSHTIPVDVPEVWPSIQYLWLYDVGLTADTISNLHLQQLTQLHTIECVAWSWYCSAKLLDARALHHLLHAGGLPSLQKLVCLDDNAARTLQQLKPFLSHRVTQLLVGNSKALAAIRGWTALQEVQCIWGSWNRSNSKKAVRQIFSHPALRIVVVPMSMFSTATRFKSTDRKLELLELTADTGPVLSSLLNIPVHNVTRLRFKGGIHVAHDLTPAERQHMQQCHRVQVVPDCMYLCGTEFMCGSILEQSPLAMARAWSVSFQPALLDWLLPKLGNAKGVLILCGTLARSPLGGEHIDKLRALPPRVQALAFGSCTLSTDWTWTQLLAHVPQHVVYILFRRCAMTLASFQAMLETAPPADLRKVYLAQDRRYMPWVKQQQEVVRASMARRWPGVQVDLNLLECQEDLDLDESHEWYSEHDDIEDFVTPSEDY